MNEITTAAIDLLKDLIATPSFSQEEDKTANRIGEWFDHYNIPFYRVGNNVWAQNKAFDSSKPTLLLNSHHDTVQPNSAYTNDPFEPKIEEGKLAARAKARPKARTKVRGKELERKRVTK